MRRILRNQKFQSQLNNVALTKDKKNKQQYVYELKIVDEDSIKKTDLSDTEEEEFITKIKGSKLDLEHVVDLRLEFNIGKQKTPKTIKIFDSEGVNDLYHKYEKSKDIKGFTYIFTFIVIMFDSNKILLIDFDFNHRSEFKNNFENNRC